MIYWITGRADSGKTTFANEMKASIGDRAIILDADNVREVFDNKSFTDYGRKTNQLTLTYMAIILDMQDFIPIIACISPVAMVRKECYKVFEKFGCSYSVYYISGGTMWAGTTYEEPDFIEVPEEMRIDGPLWRRDGTD